MDSTVLVQRDRCPMLHLSSMFHTHHLLSICCILSKDRGTNQKTTNLILLQLFMSHVMWNNTQQWILTINTCSLIWTCNCDYKECKGVFTMIGQRSTISAQIITLTASKCYEHWCWKERSCHLCAPCCTYMPASINSIKPFLIIRKRMCV